MSSHEIHVQESVLSDTSYNEEQQKPILNVLSYCQIIHKAIQNPDKNFDVINGTVSKIYYFCAKSMWQNHPLGYAYKNYNYLLSRKIKLQKVKREPFPSSLSYPDSESPTMPVERPENDSQSNPVGASYQTGFQGRDQELLYQEQEPCLNQRPMIHSIFTPTSVI